VGDNIRFFRTLKGWPQKTLAAEAGISQPYLSKIEDNKAAPRFCEVERMALLLGRPLQDFATRLGNGFIIAPVPDEAAHPPLPLAPDANERSKRKPGKAH